jgi:hypothetical protein
MLINQEYIPTAIQRHYMSLLYLSYVQYYLILCAPCRDRTALRASGQGVFSSAHGILCIPTHPWRRFSRLHCVWTVLLPVGDSVSFSYELFSLERLGEYVSAVALCTSITSPNFILSQSQKYRMLMCHDHSDVGPPRAIIAMQLKLSW